MGDAPGRAGAGHLAQVDAGLAGAQPHRRRGERPLALRARGADRRRRGAMRARGRARAEPSAATTARARGRAAPAGLAPSGASAVGGRGSARVAFDLQPDQRRADRDGVADLGAEPDHLAVDRRGDLDGRLVGHHRGEHRVLAHDVAGLHVPFDELGLGDALADVGQLDDVLGHAQPSITSTSASPTRFGPGEVVPLLGVRIGRVPAGDAGHRRLEVVEAVLLDQRGELGAEARGQRRLVHDHAAAGLLHRGDDRVEVERQA